MHNNHRVEPELAHESMGVLFRRLSHETTMLIRQELELAKAEIVEKGKQAAGGVGLFGAAAVLGLAAFGAFTAFLIAALSLAMALWLAALIVTLVYTGIAGVMAAAGREKVKRASPLVPEQAIESTKESVLWVRTRMKSGTI